MEAAHSAQKRKIDRRLLKILFFPWGLWSLAAWLPRKMRQSAAGTGALRRMLSFVLQAFLYGFIALPITVVMLGELLITLNEYVIAEQADYRLQSDFEMGTAGNVLDVPGPKAYSPPPMEPAQTDAYRRYLVELYAPVILHKISGHPEWDIPRFLDFDGTIDPRDNVANEKKYRAQEPGVYGEMTAETEDSYYLTYSLYHVKDYDHPIREKLIRWTYHDNDNEGFHMRVDKKTMEIAEVETWFHNRFLLFNHSGISQGTEPVHGTIHVENGTHVLVYAQPQGHGVRLLQFVDLPSVRRNVKIMRYRGDRPVVTQRANRSTQVDVTYALRNFDNWYKVARGPFLDRDKDSEAGIFEDAIELGDDADGNPREIGRYIAGRDYYVGGWSRPKPMWSWDDGWDKIPNLVWHFYPSLSFQSHGGQNISQDYVFNRPVERTFGVKSDEFAKGLRLEMSTREGDKWDDFADRGGKVDRQMYWGAFAGKFAFMLKSYVNYVFHALG